VSAFIIALIRHYKVILRFLKVCAAFGGRSFALLRARSKQGERQLIPKVAIAVAPATSRLNFMPCR
jgi:hypothetical protein